MMSNKNMVLAVWMVLVLVGGAIAADKRAAAQPAGNAEKGKNVSLRQVVQDLSKEAEEAIKENKPLPRTVCDYAKTKGDVILRERDLMLGLTKSQDRNPLVDSYIKWQLLSFQPDFAKMKPADLVRIMDAIPAPEPLGQMDPRDVAMLKAGKGGKGGRAQLQKIIDQFQEHQKQVAVLNKPNQAYAKVVFDATTSDKGLNLIAKVRHLEMAIDGGNESIVNGQIKAITAELLSLRTDKSLSPPMRGELVRRIKQIAGHSREIVVNATLKASDDEPVSFNEKTIKLGDKQIEEMVAYLEDREYAAPKK
ncbi:MAG: hypothetical protein WC058_14450 [Phycisphaeraceae bacterium]